MNFIFSKGKYLTNPVKIFEETGRLFENQMCGFLNTKYLSIIN